MTPAMARAVGALHEAERWLAHGFRLLAVCAEDAAPGRI
jgi:hypothetical protein